ncbi:hypothetical protein ENBRE01_2058 [Enteropsectra breve]|nr:hypothetical protein ENBRE01_2058 [Enteropsectra breve]
MRKFSCCFLHHLLPKILFKRTLLYLVCISYRHLAPFLQYSKCNDIDYWKMRGQNEEEREVSINEKQNAKVQRNKDESEEEERKELKKRKIEVVKKDERMDTARLNIVVN